MVKFIYMYFKRNKVIIFLRLKVGVCRLCVVREERGLWILFMGIFMSMLYGDVESLEYKGFFFKYIF